MTDTDIVTRLAREAGLEVADDAPKDQVAWGQYSSGNLALFAALVVHECAKVCEGMHPEDRPGDYAYAIRARFGA